MVIYMDFMFACPTMKKTGQSVPESISFIKLNLKHSNNVNSGRNYITM